jgi:hypothetical protein
LKSRINASRRRNLRDVSAGPCRQTPKCCRLAAWFQRVMKLLNPTTAWLSCEAESDPAPDLYMSSSTWNIMTTG